MIMYMLGRAFFIYVLIVPLLSCSLLILDSDDLQVSVDSVLVVVEKGIFAELSPSLNLYRSDLAEEGTEVTIREWEGDARDLREELKKYSDGTWTAWFLGDLPSVNYVWEGEVFPTDLYFSSPDTSWDDRDGDGTFDSHGTIFMSVPVSRLTGSTEELIGYFHKIHLYRTGVLTFEDRAVLFKDDDWSDYRRGSFFGAERIAGEVFLVENLPQSTYQLYEEALLGRSKYLYQWIHANPSALYVQEGTDYTPYRYYAIDREGVDVGFLNLFNCQAARYTQPNLAMSYLSRTDTSLAVTGSTKKGGNFEPLEFHRVLSLGRSWAEAFRQWYNKVGVHDDMWYLGMVIFGDPALIPGGDDSRQERSDFSRLISPSEEEKEYYFNLMSDFTEPPY